MNKNTRPKDPFEIVGPNIRVFKYNDIERSGTREIVPIEEKKMLNFSFTCFKDPRTGIWYGITDGQDYQTKRPIFRRITITGRRLYNLENEEDAIEWAIISRHPSTLGSFLQKGLPLVKPYDRKKIAVARLQKIKRGAEAVDIALNHLKGNELLDFARLLAITPENNDYEVVAQLVAEKAQRDPELFMDKYSDANKEILIVINRARSTGMIKYKIDHGFVYNDSLPLGSSDIAVITYFKNNVRLLESIDLESKAASKETYGTEEPEIVEVEKGAVKKNSKKDVDSMDWDEIRDYAAFKKIKIHGKKKSELVDDLKNLEQEEAAAKNPKIEEQEEVPVQQVFTDNDLQEADHNTENDDAILQKVSAEPSTVAAEM